MNSGHRRSTAFVERTEKTPSGGWEVVKFPTFTGLAYAGIVGTGKARMPETLLNRSIIIYLLPATSDEQPEHLIDGESEVLYVARRKIARFVADIEELPTAALAGCASGESLKANSDFSKALGEVRFEREGSQVELASYDIPLKFVDASERSSIQRILLDVSYNPPADPDFFVVSSVKVQGAAKVLSETALCNWNDKKTVADCQVEDDGGRFRIVTKKRGTSLKESEFALRIAPLGGYRGFRVGADEVEPDATVYVALTRSRAVDIPISTY